MLTVLTMIRKLGLEDSSLQAFAARQSVIAMMAYRFFPMS
jgi:hypothetical protein